MRAALDKAITARGLSLDASDQIGVAALYDTHPSCDKNTALHMKPLSGVSPV